MIIHESSNDRSLLPLRQRHSLILLSFIAILALSLCLGAIYVLGDFRPPRLEDWERIVNYLVEPSMPPIVSSIISSRSAGNTLKVFVIMIFINPRLRLGAQNSPRFTPSVGKESHIVSVSGVTRGVESTLKIGITTRKAGIEDVIMQTKQQCIALGSA